MATEAAALYRLPRVLLLAAALVTQPTTAPSPSAGDISAVLESALAKPRPSGAYSSGSRSLQLHAAKNEVESFLVVVSGGASGLEGVSVEFAAPMPGAAVTLHAANYVNATKPSGCTGAVGLWADPLVPAVDVYAGERRNAFPLSVPPRENRIVWVDVFVPLSARAGSTSHAVDVRASGGGDPVRNKPSLCFAIVT